MAGISLRHVVKRYGDGDPAVDAALPKVKSGGTSGVGTFGMAQP